MYAGHAAIALLVKGIRPRISLAVLVPVAFAPDWVEWFFGLAGQENRQLSHSLISVGIGATIVALIYWAFKRSASDAAIVGLVYVSHWPADFVTGVKPTWPGGPDVGMFMYGHPFVDIALEASLVVLCWLVYRRSLPATSRNRPIGLLIPVGLIAMQFGFHAVQKPEVKGPLHDIIDGVGSLGASAYHAPRTSVYVVASSPPGAA